MSNNINLLPIDLSTKGRYGKIASILKRVSYFSVITFVVIGVLSTAFILFTNFEIRKNDQKIMALQENVKILEPFEQQQVLIKDRIQKTKAILSNIKMFEEIGNVSNIISALPSEIILSDLEVDGTKTKMAFKTGSVNSLTSFLSQLSINKAYKQIIIRNFSYNPANGYLVSLEASR